MKSSKNIISMKRIRDKLLAQNPNHIWTFKGCKATCEICSVQAEYNLATESWVCSTISIKRNDCREKAMNEALE